MEEQTYDFPRKTNEHCINCNRFTLDTTAHTFTGKQYIEHIDGGDDFLIMGEYKCDDCNKLIDLTNNTVHWNKKRDETDISKYEKKHDIAETDDSIKGSDVTPPCHHCKDETNVEIKEISLQHLDSSGEHHQMTDKITCHSCKSTYLYHVETRYVDI